MSDPDRSVESLSSLSLSQTSACPPLWLCCFFLFRSTTHTQQDTCAVVNENSLPLLICSWSVFHVERSAGGRREKHWGEEKKRDSGAGNQAEYNISCAVLKKKCYNLDASHEISENHITPAPCKAVGPCALTVIRIADILAPNQHFSKRSKTTLYQINTDENFISYPISLAGYFCADVTQGEKFEKPSRAVVGEDDWVKQGTKHSAGM